MNIAQTIIANAKSNISLLNWDGETSKADMLENIRRHIKRFNGWDRIYAEFEDGVLKIAAMNSKGDVEHLLRYNPVTGRELYGRLRHVSITYALLKELEVLPTLV